MSIRIDSRAREEEGEEIEEDHIQHPTHRRNGSEEINIIDLRYVDRHLVFSLPYHPNKPKSCR
jgi:hypothetical protein